MNMDNNNNQIGNINKINGNLDVHKLDEKMNLHGEFLGISSLAVYSAPWFLQIILLIIIGIVFYYKIFEHSRDLFEDISSVYSKIQETVEDKELLKKYQKNFLGLKVSKKQLPTYWSGFALFFITLIYSLINTLILRI